MTLFSGMNHRLRLFRHLGNCSRSMKTSTAITISRHSLLRNRTISTTTPALNNQSIPFFMLDVKGFFKTEWGRKFDETVRRLNSAPNFQMLEVGPNGTLLGGDLGLITEENDKFQVVIKDVKPGIWTITDVPREQPWAFVGIYLRWATVGPLDWDNLPTSIPEPESISTGGWERVGGYWIDSGVQGLLDEDSLNHLIETHEDHDRVTVLEVISEYTTLLPTLAVRAGFAKSDNDGMYSILARTEDGGKVEILVIPDALRKFWDETLAHAEDNQHK